MIEEEFIDYNSTLCKHLNSKWTDFKNKDTINTCSWENFIVSLDLGIHSLGLIEIYNSTLRTVFCHRYKITNKKKWLLTRLKYSI